MSQHEAPVHDDETRRSRTKITGPSPLGAQDEGAASTGISSQAQSLQRTAGNRAVSGLLSPLTAALAKRRQQVTGRTREDAEAEPGTPAAMIKQREESQLASPAWQTGLKQNAEDSVSSGMPNIKRSARQQRSVDKRKEQRMSPAVDFIKARVADAEASHAAELELARKPLHEAAKPAAEARHDVLRTRQQALTGKNKYAGLSLSQVTSLAATMKTIAKEERWADADDVLDGLRDEMAKLTSYLTGLESTETRLMALAPSGTIGKKQIDNLRYSIRNTEFRAFSNATRANPRNDAVATAALTALETRLQTEEDRLSADQAAVLLKQQVRAEGRWPANNRTDAEIKPETRATVGASDDERTAIVGALDALKNNGAHGWARKWGAYHGNGEGNLPGAAAGLGGYKEYYVRPAGAALDAAGLQPAGTRRLVVSDTTGFVYYSDNHYGQPNGQTLPAFVKVTDA